MPTRGALKNLALLGASSAVLLVLIDVLAFALGLRLPGYGQEKFFQYSPITGFTHAPNVEGTWYRYEDGTRFHVRTNGFGYPDRDRSLQKERPRIALIGDSTTQHWEAEEADRPQVVLEELVGRRFEVLNQGVRAFGTDQTDLLFEAVGVHFEPDVVVYTFCINDFHDNAMDDRKPRFALDPATGTLERRGHPFAMPPPPAISWRDRAKQSFITRRVHLLVSRLRGGPTPLSDHFELRPYRREYDAVDAERRDLTLAVLDRLSRFVRERGMRFLIVESIYRHAYDDASRAEIQRIYGDVFDFDKVSGLLESFSRERQIPFVSLPRRWRAENVPIAEIMHREDNMHLNGRGARLYAQSLYEALEAEGWLGEPAAGGGP